MVNYTCIGQVALHRDNEKLCIAEKQAEDFDVSQLYCSNWFEIKDVWDEVEQYRAELLACELNPDCLIPPIEPIDYAFKVDLIYGSTYIGCSGKKTLNQGVEVVKAYYSYARYLMLNGLNDTSSGFVGKTNEFSVPKTAKELQTYSDQYRNMGLFSFENTVSFLCGNKSVFTWYNSGDCKAQCGCGCSNDCGTTKARGYGLRSFNISK